MVHSTHLCSVLMTPPISSIALSYTHNAIYQNTCPYVYITRNGRLSGTRIVLSIVFDCFYIELYVLTFQALPSVGGAGKVVGQLLFDEL